jgi:hypothetical protein
MHIAQIAPLTEAVPPKLYGGTERVISWLPLTFGQLIGVLQQHSLQCRKF